MPTFRDIGGNAFSDGALDARGLATFATDHDILLVRKFHPYEDIKAVSTFPNFRFCASDEVSEREAGRYKNAHCSPFAPQIP